MRQVLNHRIRRLGADPGRLLSVAAAFGAPFDLAVAAHVAGLDEATALTALEAALRAELVRPPESGVRYDFMHALIRETIHSNLSPLRRVRLHRQIAETMEHVYGDRIAEHSAEVAQQYLVIAFTHFDQVQGDNLPRQGAGDRDRTGDVQLGKREIPEPETPTQSAVAE